MTAYGGRTGVRAGLNPSHTQVDVSTQADLVGYESEDERMGRRSKNKRGTPYSKVDIREQYCINNKEVQVLESGSSALFGCLSKHHDGSCRSRHSFLSVCMGRVPSDENLHDFKLQPLPRRPIEDLERAYLRRRPESLWTGDPDGCEWISEIQNEEPSALGNKPHEQETSEHARIKRGHTMSFSSEHLATSCPAHCLLPPPPPPAGSHRTKHVSFARSHTLTSFDDAIIELRKIPRHYKSQERLILSALPQKKTFHTSSEQRIAKRPPMKTQATQTGSLGREPPTYLSLSPRTVHRVKMVSQGAQTNGQPCNGRRLMKSYSEAGYHSRNGHSTEKTKEHDALTRTQSEEPRSPFATQDASFCTGTENSNTPDSRKPEEGRTPKSSKMYKEIFIDFEPVQYDKRSRQSFANEDFLFKQEMNVDAEGKAVDTSDGINMSLASFDAVSEYDIPNEVREDRPTSFPLSQDSVDEEFHENLIYGGILSEFSTSELTLKPISPNDKDSLDKGSGASTPDNKSIGPMATLNISRWVSPFASNDSLANDPKDHSDGIWNESQSTVLQADLENGEVSSRTPSKKQMLLLQHQQRSSIDTEVLESDALQPQSSLHPSSKQETTVPFVTVAAVHYNDFPATMMQVSGSVQSDRRMSCHNLGPHVFFGLNESRKKISKSPDKDETRMDPGKMTDISEASTTDDYATAHDNSGTDTSSRKSTAHRKGENKPGSKEGSSFDSASSAHSFTKEEVSQLVPSSPSLTTRYNITEETETEINEPAEKKHDPVEKSQKEFHEKEEVSGDAESSSSGSYSLSSAQREQKVDARDREKPSIQKNIRHPNEVFDISNDAETRTARDDKEHIKIEMTSVSSGSQQAPREGKTNSAHGRENQQATNKKRIARGVDDVTTKMVRSPAMLEGFLREEDRPSPYKPISRAPEETPSGKNEAEVSSDESSYDLKIASIEDATDDYSPRRQRKRAGRGRKNHGVMEGAPRRRNMTLVPPHSQHQANPPQVPSKYGRSPIHSPKGSPRKHVRAARGKDHGKANAESPEAVTHLKTLSTESLRSVSPGSDSVFYNESEPHVLCRQCGREFEGETSPLQVEETVADIVQPPAGFADSPETSRSKSHRLYKKQEKRFRSEERGERRRHSRYRSEGLRAKSEERGKDKIFKSKLRPHARSTNSSMEKLRCADSSPSMSEPLTCGEPKIYADSFQKGSWICIREGEVGPAWNRSLDSDDASKQNTDSTSSEKEFKRKYRAATHRMVHRKSSMEMYKRLQSKSFECDMKVVVRRKSGEFGFRIHGSRPVVVSAIEPDTPAESSGLEVGDIVLSVNGTSVLEASHSDVVKLAHAGSDTLELEVARTSSALTSVSDEKESTVIAGFLSKRGTNGRWHQRWFALKNDNCLYCFKSQTESQPIGALMLFNYKFRFTSESDKPNGFVLSKEGAKTLEVFADTEELAHKWKTHLEKAMEVDVADEGQWLDKNRRLLRMPAASVSRPDCFGYLTQLEDKWRRRYCVLKDAALLLYADDAASSALAVACLQGYKVQSSGVSGKRFSFEVIPPESKQKYFHFYTDTEMDKKRWIAAIEYSIDRWMRVG